ncbi:MAG: PspC domain-containing protein [Brumimicrobium sp.]|nr:PspC domain-containing protein [Brumimicrobium sp.]
MKKTVTINVAGLVFNIEEDGYNRLKLYLDEIRKLLAGEEGVNEIIEDIEARIAEIFLGQLNESKQVITEGNVHEVIQIMGEPTDYSVPDPDAEEESQNKENATQPNTERISKRLYRDDENGVIGGVSSGLGHYFDIDPVIIRIIFILMVILGGSGILVYIILWIVIPEAKTTAQKLEMRGQPATLDNIKEFVSGFTKEAKGGATRAASSIKQSVHKGRSVVKSILLLFAKILGIAFIAGGIIFLVGSLIFFFGDFELINFTSENMDNNLKTIFSALYPSGTSNWAFWSLLFVILLPILAIVSVGIKLLFNYKGKIKFPFIGGLIAWIIAIVILGYTGLQLGLDFKSEFNIEEEIENTEMDSTQVLYLTTNYSEDYSYLLEGALVPDEHNFIHIGKEEIEMGMPFIEIIHDTVLTNFSVAVKKRSNGKTPKAAMENTRAIKYQPNYFSDSLVLPITYSFPKSSKLRAQVVTVEIRVPTGKSVVIPDMPFDMRFEISSGKDHFYHEPEAGERWTATKEGFILSE